MASRSTRAALPIFRYLRRERRQSPRSEADADHVRVKTEMLQLRLTEKKRQLLHREDFDEAIDSIAGIVITAAAWRRGAPTILTVRRKIDAVVYEIRKEMAKAALAMADKNGEPPLDEVTG
jgi:hypothetical protein